MHFKINLFTFLLGAAVLTKITDTFKNHEDAKVKIAKIESENKKN